MKSAHRNIWTENAELLRPAFMQAVNWDTSQLVILGISEFLPKRPCRVLDVGGGGGYQAVLLAKMGHHVTVVDIDENMILEARKTILSHDDKISEKIELIVGSIFDISSDRKFDLVCCHSVLMYEPKWKALIKKLAWFVSENGIISILSTNPESIAMRLGFQSRWREVIATISLKKQTDATVIPNEEISLQELTSALDQEGIGIIAWYGVGVFEGGEGDDHLAAEWLLGKTDPYRGVARCFHIIGKRNID